MVQSVVSKGKDVSEAITLGLTILGVEREAVSIVVIQQETKSLFRKKPAIVKLEVNEAADKRSKEPTSLNQEQMENLINHIDPGPLLKDAGGKASFSSRTDLNGKVWVEDGKILGKPTELTYPTISSKEGIILYKNKEIVSGTAVFTLHDIFEVEVQDEMVETKWDVLLDRDKLHAMLHVEPGKHIARTLKDMEPNDHIDLQAVEHIEIQTGIEYKDVLGKLESLKVVHGFNYSEIMTAINSKDTADFVIASGVKPQAGEDGYLQVLIDTQGKESGPKKRADGTVDYREIKHVPTVNQGQVIAIVHAPVPGVPGTTVTNEPIPAKQVYPLVVQPGKGIALIENGTKIVATEKGRPKIETKGQLAKVSIVQKLVHSGDVNISSGNIHFKGDIDVLGNVEEHMMVEADGQVMVTHNVNMATVISKSVIVVGQNVIGSVLSSGKNNSLLSELIDLLNLIHREIEKVRMSMEQLLKVPAFKLTDYEQKGLLPLIKLLIGKKFKSFPEFIMQYIELCKRENKWLDQEFIDVAETLRLSFLSSVPNQLHNIDQLEILYGKIQDILEKNQLDEEEDCFIELQYAINSRIFSSGNVTITGQGCFNTKIQSGGELKIHGVLRGGEVYGRLGAFIKEVGSEGAISTHITVPHDQKIHIEFIREGTVLQIGHVKHKVTENLHHIEAKLDKNGKIIF